MAYQKKKSKTFIKDLENYLIQNPILNYEENLINNFSSSNLSDLYKLFLDLKGLTLDYKLYNKLKNILNKNFSIKLCNIFGSVSKNSSVSISSEHIHSLELIIKEKYLNYISDSSISIDKNELYKLSVIVNKIFPDVFLNLIKTPNANIKVQQQFINDKILATIDHAYSHNAPEAEEENADILSAIYVVTNKLYPELNIYEPGRIKSFKSIRSNMQKEICNSLKSLLPSDVSVGLTDADVQEQFNLTKANNDFSGFTIVLSNVDDTMHLDLNDPKNQEIFALRKNKNSNISFMHSLENFLLENEDLQLSNLDLLQIKIELLIRLRDSTYDECLQEYNNTNFTKLLDKSIKNYYAELKTNNKTIDNEKSEYLAKINEIYKLIDELKKRVDDKYQSKLLEINTEHILSDSIFTDVLNVSFEFVKNVKKRNGYCSRYYRLMTGTGREIELQFQSCKRYKDSKDGPSDHSTLDGKEINILHFFEPVDPNCEPEKFKYFLNILNTTPISTKNHLLYSSDHDLSPSDIRAKRKLRAAEENVKLKEQYVVENKLNDGTTFNSSYSLDTYLPIFAEYVSPKSMVVSSPHTRFNTSVAGYHKKSLLSSFKNVLLKCDSTSCLAQKLIDRLENIILEPNKNEISLNGIIRRSKDRFRKHDNSSSFER